MANFGGTAVHDEVDLGRGAITDLAAGPDGQVLVAAHRGSGAVSILDASTLSVLAVSDRLTEPHCPIVDVRVYVAGVVAIGPVVAALDTATGALLGGKTVSQPVGSLAIDATGRVLYVGHSGEGGAKITAVDTESGDVTTVRLAGADAVIGALKADVGGARLYAALSTRFACGLAVVDPDNALVVKIVAVNGTISDLAVRPDGRIVYVAGWDDEAGGVIRVFDVAAGRVVDCIGVGALPRQLVMGDGAKLYVLGGECVAVIDTRSGEILERIAATGQVACIAVIGERLFAGGYHGVLTELTAATADRVAQTVGPKRPKQGLALAAAVVAAVALVGAVGVVSAGDPEPGPSATREPAGQAPTPVPRPTWVVTEVPDAPAPAPAPAPAAPPVVQIPPVAVPPPPPQRQYQPPPQQPPPLQLPQLPAIDWSQLPPLDLSQLPPLDLSQLPQWPPEWGPLPQP